MIKKISDIFNNLGPGVLLAATAIGVSHLVQSVQAGANYGLLFIAIIIFAHVLKYPFFEIAPRYSAAKKQSILHGYYDINPRYLYVYLIATLLSLFTLLSAVTVVAAGIFANIFKLDFSIKIYSIFVIVFCYIILTFGKYDLLDRWAKYIILFLVISSLASFAISFQSLDSLQHSSKKSFSLINDLDLIFLLGFIGWMPCPLDCSIWNSIWIVEKNNENREKINLNKSLTDFNIGYAITAILAILFLLLGYIMFFYTNEELPVKSVEFIAKLLEIYTKNIGEWSFYIIAFTAFIAMFSTVLTCTDGYPRSLAKTIKLLFYVKKNKNCNEDKIYLNVLTGCVVLTIITIVFLVENMKQLVLIATMISFLTTPVIAWLNLKLVTKSDFPKEYRPSKKFILYSKFAIFIMIGFVILYLGTFL